MITKVKIVILYRSFMTGFIFAYNLEKDEEIKNPQGLLKEGKDPLKEMLKLQNFLQEELNKKLPYLNPKPSDLKKIGEIIVWEYYQNEVGIEVEVGDGYRHEVFIEDRYWNRIIKIIKDDELDEEGILAIVKGLMNAGLREEHVNKFISAIKKGKIKEIEIR